MCPPDTVDDQSTAADASHISNVGTHLEVDESRAYDSSSDSAYGGTNSDVYAFMKGSGGWSQSTGDFRQEYGRTYHSYKDGKYHLPNDEIEADRLDLQHQLYLITLEGKLFLSPLGENVSHAIDIGTGTGIWAIEFADLYPKARVFGTDLSPVQPAFVPPNCEFLIEDSEEPWIFKNKFDFIHGRMLTVSLRNWPRFFEQSFENMNPGGWVEMQDLRYPIACDDDTLPEDSAIKKWSYLMMEAAQSVGQSLDSCSRYASQMHDAGFINIHETVYKWPMNTWPLAKKDKIVGAWTMENFSNGVQGFTMAYFSRVLGWSQEAVEIFLVGVRKELKDRRKHGYFPIHVVYGQKPPAPTRQGDDTNMELHPAEQTQAAAPTASSSTPFFPGEPLEDVSHLPSTLGGVLTVPETTHLRPPIETAPAATQLATESAIQETSSLKRSYDQLSPSPKLPTVPSAPSNIPTQRPILETMSTQELSSISAGGIPANEMAASMGEAHAHSEPENTLESRR